MSLVLSNALRVRSDECIAFVGSGGKTTALFQLARQLTAPVIVSATSHLGAWQTSLADFHVIAETSAALRKIDSMLNGVILVTGQFDGDRTKPLYDELLIELREYCLRRSMPMLIEADGSRQKPLKGWADHEPPIPEFVTKVVFVAGLKGLGKPLNDEFVHRVEKFSSLAQLKVGEIIAAENLIKALTDKNGGMKNAPNAARKVLLLNQADTAELQATGRGLAQSLLGNFDSVIISSLISGQVFAVHEPVAGIVLAAGEASRYKEPKQLLDWKGDPFVRVVARRALEAGLSPVLVITGAHADEVEPVIADLNVSIVRNQNWMSGQGSSISLAVKTISSINGRETSLPGACIFLLADQPQLTSSILTTLVEKHAEGLYPVVAPMIMDRRANPVLFDRQTFPDLIALEGDVGGRAIFHKHRVEYLPWHDDRLLLDVDTPEQYQRLLADDTL